jgi:murein L,D-transpeptidase YcbB/YkuD
MTRRLCQLLIAAYLSTALLSCNGNSTEKNPLPGQDTLPSRQKADPSIPGNFSPQTSLRFDSSEIDAFLARYPELKEFGREMRNFYRGRSHAYAWFDERGLIEQTSDLFYRIENITDEGIPFHVPYMREYRLMMVGDDSTEPRTERSPEMELMITAQYFHYAKDAWAGIPESQTKQLDWYMPRKRLGYDVLLDSMLNSLSNGRPLQEPVNPQYNLLKGYLKRFREIERKGSWFTIQADRNKYQLGDTGKAVAEIRRKLFLAGDLGSDDGSRTFDATMEEGVKRYQARYGLTADGKVGASVLQEMNAPLSKRIRQIVVNMERARWVGPEPPGDHLVVNIPQYELMVYRNDSLMWSCRVVVGKEANKTAIFQGQLKYVVFSPYWNVPASILNKEIMPKLRRNPGYLASQHMEWNGNGVRQKPGPWNALGRVKFLFPNSFSMYLHDTPSKSLFERDKRAFSHGCIRVSEPRKLALHLLENDPDWPASRIDEAMDSGKEQFVTLKKGLPVSILYFTAWVDPKGRIHFRDDVYERDERVMEMIFSKK